jgi:hypothetical protein
LPAYLEFEMPAGAEYFTLDVNVTRVHQPLSDRAHVPAAASAKAPAPQPPQPPSAPPRTPAPPAPAAPAKAPAEDDDPNAEWRGIDLEFGKPGEESGDVDLERPKDS